MEYSDLVKVARDFYSREHAAVNRFRGGMPAGFLAAIAAHESAGRMVASGDPVLAEYGYFQVTAQTARDFCNDPELRKTTAGNVFLACLEYNVNAARLQVDFPELIAPGTADHWLVARLTFAIGYGGTRSLIKASRPKYGQVYRAILRHGGIAAGSQSKEKVTSRIRSTGLLWIAGEDTTPLAYGAPRMIPALVPYCVPRSVKGILTASTWMDTAISIGALLSTLIFE